LRALDNIDKYMKLKYGHNQRYIGTSQKLTLPKSFIAEQNLFLYKIQQNRLNVWKWRPKQL